MTATTINGRYIANTVSGDMFNRAILGSVKQFIFRSEEGSQGSAGAPREAVGKIVPAAYDFER